jgi:ABC-type transport system involved in multi-copper enzyme maturation permease subunit
MREREVRNFSGTLFGYTVRSNRLLMLVITLVFCIFTLATNAATYMLSTDTKELVDEESQNSFYTYLGTLAAYDRMTGATLSYEDFTSGGDADQYEQAFALYNAQKDADKETLSPEGFASLIEAIDSTDTDPATLVRSFEYAYALQDRSGVFTGEELSMDDMVDTMLSGMGISTEDLERMQDMDFTFMLTRIYYTAMGALIMFLFVIIAASGLVASQVDRGSMAYLLSAPNRRRAVTLTQLVYMLAAPAVIMTVGCILRIVSTKLLFGEVCVPRLLCLYLGMYLLVQAIAGICYMCSCHFNESNRALAVGGGFAIWCFLASLLGMFGSKELIDMGIGVTQLGVFNKLTLISLFDIQSIQTIGTGELDTGFVPKLIILGVIALTAYIIGIVRFDRKDLPL